MSALDCNMFTRANSPDTIECLRSDVTGMTSRRTDVSKADDDDDRDCCDSPNDDAAIAETVAATLSPLKHFIVH